MKALIKTNALLLLLILFAFASITNAQKPKRITSQKFVTAPTKDKEELDAIAELTDVNQRIEKLNAFIQQRPKSKFKPLATEMLALDTISIANDLNERVGKLNAFITGHPKSKLLTRASEMLSGVRAAIADEKLRLGDNTGVELFHLAISEAPANCSDKLFDRVLSQIPSNLFWRNEQKAAMETAKLLEEKVKDNPTRLLAVAAFYLGVEAADEAVRVAQNAIALAPEMSSAHQALGAAYRINFQLDESANAYAKAVELDPNSTSARKSLADIRRAQGRDEEALLLYRGLLEADKTDEFARAGFIMSLLNMNKREDAENEMKTALEENPNSLVLLTNAAYWYAAKSEGEKAVEYAQKAVQIEPRYVWAQIALARGLVLMKRPLDAERSLLFAKQYGSFPTLDYELASVLASLGLYEEASRTLSRSFVVEGGTIKTRLGNRAETKAESFIELLAPERRASIFQSNAADSETNAKILKNLLAFSSAINQSTKKEEEIVLTSQEFVSGEDAMKTHRQLYVASRLLQNDIALSQALTLTQDATSGVEASLDVPSATVAVMADELYDVRANAVANGATANLPDVQRSVLSNIMRGRIEDIAGWTLFNQNKYAEAIVRLRRALTVLPENSVYWRTAMWHLGAAHEANGNPKEALNAYYKSYNSKPDANRRTIIEALYKKVNGTLDGLDKKIGESPSATSVSGKPNITANETSANNEQSKTSQTNSNPVVVINRPDPTLDAKLKILQKPETKTEQTVTPSVTEQKTETSAQKAEPTPSPSPVTETKTEGEQKTEQSSEVKTEKTAQPSETKPETNPPTTEEKPSTENKTETPRTNKTETSTENKVENKTETPSETNTEKKEEPKTEPTQTTEVKQKPSPTEEKPAQTEEQKPSEEQTAKLEKKADETAKVESKPDETKKADNKPDETKSVESNKVEAKPDETKIENKPEETKVGSKPDETAKTEPKTDETKKAESKPDEIKTEIKSEETAKVESKPEETAKPSTTETKTENKTEQPSSPNMSKPDETKTETAPVESSPDTKLRQRIVGEETNKQVTTEETTPTQTRPRIVTTNTTQPKDENTNKTTDACSINVSEEKISVLNNGGTVSVTVELNGMSFEGNVTVENDWANIAVFLEPKVKTDGRSALFSITSVSKNTGDYKVTFKSPCGSKTVTVKVR